MARVGKPRRTAGKGVRMSARDYKRVFIVIAALVAIFLAYQQIPHIHIGERAQGSYEGGIASDEDVSKAVREAQEAADKAGRAGPAESSKKWRHTPLPTLNDGWMP